MLATVAHYIKKHKFLFIVSIIYFVIRLILLDHAYLLRGERDITLTGYFLARTGRDLYGNLLPVEFYSLDMPTPLLAFYYSALWYVIIPIKSVFMARLPYVFATTFYIFLVYELVKELTKNKPLAVVTSLVFSFAPGIYHLSRLALEVNIATPLLFGGILLFLKKQRWYAYFLFVLVYFTYNGFRPLLLPLLLLLELYPLLSGKKWKDVGRGLVMSTLFFFVLLGFGMLFIDGGLTLSRKADLVFLSYQDIDPLVIFRRNTAVGPELLKQVFNNKITATVYYMIEVFFRGQDLHYLFFKGDPAAIYATTFSGLFFMIMLPMYYLGFIYMGRKFKKEYWLILGFILVGLFPSLINIDYISFTIRSILSTFGYAFIIGAGILLFWELISKTPTYIKVMAVVLVVGILGLELMYFSYNYFYRRPKTMFESFFESEKNIAEYILENDQKFTIYDDNPRNIIATYYFLKPNLNVSEAQQILKAQSPYKMGNAILRDCPKTGENPLQPWSIIADSCLDEETYQKLAGIPTKKIMFEDFSERYAFIIFETEVPKLK